jgi:diguanylate cyclase (GGDEF)-like protein
MRGVDAATGDGGIAPAPAALRPFPVALLTAGLITMALLIGVASAFTFIAQTRLQELRWDHQAALHRDIDWYLTAGTYIRAVALCMVVMAGIIIRRGTRRLDAARLASEAIAAELRDQKRQLRALNDRLFEEARIDPLTKLQTRLRLSEDLKDMWANADRHGDNVCAVMCDVDRFKEYNDTYGHVAGDDVLRRVAGALLEGCRAGDRLYRYGGEEFLLILRVTSTVEGLAIADRHRSAIESLMIEHIANEAGIVTISMGLSPLWAGRFRNSTEWIEQADAALYRAKRTGRNCIAAIEDEAPVRAVA